MPTGITYAASYAAPDSIDKKARTIECVITTNSKDRQGDIVDPAGIDVKQFLQTPVVQWAHDLSQPPVGRVLSLTVDKNEIRAKVQFAETEFAKEVFSLYAGGFLRAFSIGFQPLKWKFIIPEMPKQTGKPNATAEPGPAPASNPAEQVYERSQFGMHILSAELVELSAVPVPANPDCLTRGIDSIKTKSIQDAIRTAAASAPSPEAPPAEAVTIQDKPVNVKVCPHCQTVDKAAESCPKCKTSMETKRRGKSAITGMSGVLLREFSKSIQERGAKGIPMMAIIMAKSDVAETTVEAEWEAVKEVNGEIAEAKILGISIVVPQHAKALASEAKTAEVQEPATEATPAEPSRTEQHAVADATKAIEAAVAEAKARGERLAKALLEMGEQPWNSQS